MDGWIQYRYDFVYACYMICFVFNVLFTTLVLNIKSAVFSEFEKMLVVDKVELAVTQKVLRVVLIADQASVGYRHMPHQLHNSLQTITIIFEFAR